MGLKNVVVTGTDRGLGQHLAWTLADTLSGGSTLFCSSLDRNEGHVEIAASCAARQIAFRFIPADLSTPHGVDGLVKSICDDVQMRGLNGIHGLANVAGITLEKPFAEVTAEHFQQTMWLNVAAGLFLAKGLAVLMKKAGRASIVNYGSIQGCRVLGDTEIYGISKGANNNVSHQLANCLGPEIRSNTLVIGWVPVERHVVCPDFDAASEGRAMAIGRLLSPPDVTNTAVYLLSDFSGGITGSEIYVTGGMHLKPGAGK
jgi:NAD(P)-dependent dehydrogenase (short-subunit alcohol dehydrogenase family)